jgi:hypothetical protein
VTTHRVVLRKGPAALGTGGHGHRRAMTTDATGRRITWWSCALANGGPCESEPPPKPPPPKPEPEAPPCIHGHSGRFRAVGPSGKSYCSACVTERSRVRRSPAA